MVWSVLGLSRFSWIEGVTFNLAFPMKMNNGNKVGFVGFQIALTHHTYILGIGGDPGGKTPTL